MKGSEIRQKFIEYFEKNGHKPVHSSPLLPANDPTLLFVNAGMNQFKDVFLGNEKRDYTRAASSQKCIRAGGKHNDLDEVGKTARHHTFFEMLGNFSFGDYFKEDAINFAWDFLVNELGLEENRLWFSVFEGDKEVPADTEAEELWKKAGAKPERILRFGRKDNFWQMGDTGPCGPCSEIHYYMGDEPENPEKNRANLVNNDEGDTTMEIWNLVFMQFDRSQDSEGNYKLADLPAPSVDTGMGLERISAILQGVSTNYETDLIKPIIDCIAKLADRDYETETREGFAMRVIADHARSTAFAIADGILPGNEGRNYVLRKIMRRAIFQGREHLAFDDSFFHKICDFVVGEMKEAFPELATQREFVGKMVRLEEKRFGTTLTVGLKKIDEIISDGKDISFTEFARLYDTYGTPIDLIYVVLSQKKPHIEKEFSEEEFRKHIEGKLKELQQTSQIGKTQQAEKINPIYKSLERTSVSSNFRGYETIEIKDSKVIAIVRGDEKVDEISDGEEGLVVLNKTPFYAEAGGQVGDRGVLVRTAYGSGRLNAANSDDETANDNVKPSATADGSDTSANFAKAAVIDTFAPIAGIILHKVRVQNGVVKVGDTVTASVDAENRDAIRRNHTATHLVHAALKEVLGTHVKQAGSVVAPNYLRFDFTHYQAITDAEVKEIEDLVNYYILQNEPVTTDLMSIEDAMRSGAVAMFGEKYGSDVRVLSVGNGAFSKELCGGTHVSATGDIGSFKITAGEAIASGVRRIRAITGFDALQRFREDEILIDRSLGALKTQRDQLPNAIEKLQEELKKSRKEVDELRLKIATGAIGATSSDSEEAKEISGVKVLARSVDDLDKGGMRHLSDTLMAKVRSGVVIIGNRSDAKVSFIVRVSEDLTDKIKAGNIIREIAPIVGGKGGGKPDMAEGGGSEPEKLSKAIDASYGIVESLLSE